jgi:thioredoxin reductase
MKSVAIIGAGITGLTAAIYSPNSHNNCSTVRL